MTLDDFLLKNSSTYNPDTNIIAPINEGIRRIHVLDGCSDLDFLPDSVIISCTVVVHSSTIKKLPDNMTILGTLVISKDSGLEQLPENLTVETLELYKNLNNNVIPDSTKIKRTLYVNGLVDLELPKFLVLTEDLLFFECTVTKYPEVLFVGSVCDIEKSNVNPLLFPKYTFINMLDSDVYTCHEYKFGLKAFIINGSIFPIPTIHTEDYVSFTQYVKHHAVLFRKKYYE